MKNKLKRIAASVLTLALLAVPVLAAAEPVLGDAKSAFSAVVRTPDGNPVKLRKRACKTENLYWKVQNGEAVLVERQKGEWSLVTAICTDGVRRRAWMMSRYLEG